MKKEELKLVVEGILFVAKKPVSIRKLAELTNVMITKVQEILVDLTEDYKKRGIKIIHKGDYFQMISDPLLEDYLTRYLELEFGEKLSKQALETLSIIAQKQPITRTEIEKLRKVDSESILAHLQVRGLIAEIGRMKTKGKPILYGTTFEYARYIKERSCKKSRKNKDLEKLDL